MINFFLPFALCLASLAWGEAPTNVAVMDFEGRGISKDDAIILADRFRAELIKAGAFAVMERAQMDLILKEQGFQQSGACAEASCIVQLGQLIAVGKIITGSISKIGQLYTVSVKMVDVSTGQIVQNLSEDCDCPIEKLVTSTMGRLAAQLSGIEVKGSQAVELTKGEAGLVVRTDPAGASVYFDEVMKDGVTPLSLDNLPKGKHTVRVKKGNYVGEALVELFPKKVERVTVEMALQKTQVSIKSKPLDALIYLNGRFTGNLTPFITEEVASGSYALRLTKAGYGEVADSLRIEASETNRFEYSLTPVILSSADFAKQQKLEKKIIRRNKGRRSARKYYWMGGVSLALTAVAGFASQGMRAEADDLYQKYSRETQSPSRALDYRTDSESVSKGANIAGVSAYGLGGLTGIFMATILIKSF